MIGDRPESAAQCVLGKCPDAQECDLLSNCVAWQADAEAPLPEPAENQSSNAYWWARRWLEKATSDEKEAMRDLLLNA